LCWIWERAQLSIRWILSGFPQRYIHHHAGTHFHRKCLPADTRHLSAPHPSLFSTADFKTLEKKVREHLGGDSFNKPEHIVTVIKKEFPDKYELIKKDFRDFKFKLILNQLRKQDNTALGEQICKSSKSIWDSTSSSPATSPMMSTFTTPSASGFVFRPLSPHARRQRFAGPEQKHERRLRRTTDA